VINKTLCLGLLLGRPWAARCAEVEYHLTIFEKSISPPGKQVRALAINDSIPGPVLRFRERDRARIRVTNQLPAEETSLHRHGLMVPNEQDGVPYLTMSPIEAGTSRLFDVRTHASGYLLVPLPHRSAGTAGGCTAPSSSSRGRPIPPRRMNSFSLVNHKTKN
jgi:FtsP/CotA-like multicopper oxidase with cupredoxin domain